MYFYDPGFDPTPYYDMVAGNLLKNFGDDAFSHADRAMKRFQATGENENYAIWFGILGSMVKISRRNGPSPSVSLH